MLVVVEIHYSGLDPIATAFGTTLILSAKAFPFVILISCWHSLYGNTNHHPAAPNKQQSFTVPVSSMDSQQELPACTTRNKRDEREWAVYQSLGSATPV